MQVSTNIGYICPECKKSIDVAVDTGIDKPLCPECKIEMIPNEEGNIVFSNITCKVCNSFFGIINLDKCPNCGSTFSE